MRRSGALSAQRREQGFTLVELLYTIIVIGILAAIALPQFFGYRRRAHQAVARYDLRNAYAAVRNYYVQLDDASAPKWESGEVTSSVTLPSGDEYRVSSGDSAYFYIDPTGGPHNGYCMVVISPDGDQYWANDVDGLFADSKVTGMGQCTAIANRQNLGNGGGNGNGNGAGNNGNGNGAGNNPAPAAPAPASTCAGNNGNGKGAGNC